MANPYSKLQLDFNEQMLTNLPHRDCDRYIPQRHPHRQPHPDALLSPSPAHPDSSYSHHVKSALFPNTQRLISFTPNYHQNIRDNPLNSDNSFPRPTSDFQATRIQPNVGSPVKILDVPCYGDDFYLNNIDWSEKGPVGIALGSQVFLYTPDSANLICTTPFNTQVSGIKLEEGFISVGLSSGAIEIHDIEKTCLARTLYKHDLRVSAFTFVDGLLVSGSKDKSVVIHDLRQRQHVVREFTNHKGEICTLKTKNKTESIFASGSADGSAIVWDVKYGFIDQYKGHRGAVKALDWCPWKNGLLATGGGSPTEKSIKIWNTISSKMVASQKIESQISGLLWNQECKMIVTSHGFGKNEINFWSVETSQAGGCRLQNRKSFAAHSRRILNLIQSPDQNYLCTAGADENLKFWNLHSTEADPFHPPLPRSTDNTSFRL